MKNIFPTIVKAVKNHNRIYTLLVSWGLWLFLVVGRFAGTNMALITFFIGFCAFLLFGAYISDNPNKKENEMFEKIVRYLFE